MESQKRKYSEIEQEISIAKIKPIENVKRIRV